MEVWPFRSRAADGVEGELDPQAQQAAESGGATPDQLAEDLELMGPTYVKLGQVLSGQ